jgi:hypothetical protein
MSIRRDLEKRAQEAILKSIIENYKQKHADWIKDPNIRKAIFNYAFYKPANAIIIASTILTAGCLPLVILPILALTAPIWLALGALVPLLVGIIAEVIFLAQSFNDKEAHAKAVAELLQPQVTFTPATIRDADLKAKVDKALEYWALINDEIEKSPKGILRDNSPHSVTQLEITHWLQAVHNLAEHVDKLRLNKVIQQDLEKIPAALKRYNTELQRAKDPEVKRQLERTIADQKRQLHTLETLANNIEKATYQLDSTISSLGTIYSQLLLVGTKDESGTKITRLQEEISEQVYQLEDITEAMDEVYQSSF